MFPRILRNRLALTSHNHLYKLTQLCYPNRVSSSAPTPRDIATAVPGLCLPTPHRRLLSTTTFRVATTTTADTYVSATAILPMSSVPTALAPSVSASGTGPTVTVFPHAATATSVCVASWPDNKSCIIIDPCVDFEPASGTYSFAHADGIIAYIREQGLVPRYVLDTHIHADHLSAAHYIRARFHEAASESSAAAGAVDSHAVLLARYGTEGIHRDTSFERGPRAGTGAHFPEVQETLAAVLTVPDVTPDGRGYDTLVSDGDVLTIPGTTTAEPAKSIKVMHTPGHTPSCVTYVVDDAAFVGDTIFAPDVGTARCDFPKGSAHALWTSLRAILALPAGTRLFSGHDYPPAPSTAAVAAAEAAGEAKPVARAFQACWTVAEQRARNVHVKDGVTEDDYVSMRKARDATLAAPKLLKPSIRWNIRGGAPGADAADSAASTEGKEEEIAKGAFFKQAASSKAAL